MGPGFRIYISFFFFFFFGGWGGGVGGRLRILGGARFRIWGGGARFIILGGGGGRV